MELKEKIRLKMGGQPPQDDLEKIVDSSIQETKKNEKDYIEKHDKQLENTFKELEKMSEKDEQAEAKHYEILHQAHLIRDGQAQIRTLVQKTRESNHETNKMIINELRIIHKNQGKFFFLAMILTALCFTGFGMVLHANKADILPYVDTLINGAKTVNNFTKLGD